MEFILDYWYVLLGILACVVVAASFVYQYFNLPTKTQIAKIKEWLKYAVTVAEKDLGSKTGQLKLRTVYDMFITKFPTIAKFVSFKTFSLWVDEALEWMDTQLTSNEALKEFVEK